MMSRSYYYLIGALAGVGLAAAAALWYYKRQFIKHEASFTPVASVKELWVYPLKSAHRLIVEQTECLIHGLKHDRYWAIFNRDDNKYISQKHCPKLATVKSQVEENEDGTCTLVLMAPDKESIRIQSIRIPQPVASSTTVLSINGAEGEAIDVGDAAADWISSFIGKENCRIYYMSRDNKPRQLIHYHDLGSYCTPEDQTRFADFGPVFIASQASLADLNSRLNTPVSMSCFRPNIVIDGCLPYSEDTWSEIKIGEHCVLKKLVEGQRCVITCVDQESGLKMNGNEPLSTLRKFRLYENVYGQSDSKFKAPLFGTNYGVLQTGPIAVGDIVYAKK